jgi:formylglycine-generating enzyme required for sulfatase activity
MFPRAALSLVISATEVMFSAGSVEKEMNQTFYGEIMCFEKVIPITTLALTLLAVSLNVKAASLKLESDQAVQAYQAGDYQNAATHFKKVVQLDPSNAKAWLSLGQSLTQTNDVEGARSAFAQALKLGPSDQVADRVNEQLAKLPGSILRDCPTCPEMVVIPAGSFEMGDAYNTHTVTFSHPFAIGKFEVTQAQWKAIMASNPSIFSNCGGNCPVENVTWNDTQEFIQRLNAKTGKQYRLPSEAEWEAACRGGEKQQYCGSADVQSVAWYDDGSTHPVGQKQANAFGLYDMSGNVWEWVEDGWHKNYEGAPSDGTAWQGNDSRHVIRGGSWHFDQWIIDAADRNWNVPSFRYSTLGFRLARTLP